MNTIEELKEQIKGQLTVPGDTDYDEARKIYNAMIDREPRFILYCESVADVIATINFARENGIRTSIRCGGHNGPGLSIADDGLVIDLSRMNGVQVNPDEKTVRAEGGCIWGDVDRATHAFGLAAVSGVVSTTGIGGLTLGGHGYLTRKYGLTIDNLLEADVVFADGTLVHAGKDETAWAYRDARWSMVIVGVDPDPSNKSKICRWAKDYWEAVHPYTAGGAYINFMMDEGEERIKATYRDNYARLQKVKAKYDPDNFFHVNQNIKPDNFTVSKFLIREDT